MFTRCLLACFGSALSTHCTVRTTCIGLGHLPWAGFSQSVHLINTIPRGYAHRPTQYKHSFTETLFSNDSKLFIIEKADHLVLHFVISMILTRWNLVCKRKPLCRNCDSLHTKFPVLTERHWLRFYIYKPLYI